jgi:colicin import membrane protein
MRVTIFTRHVLIGLFALTASGLTGANPEAGQDGRPTAAADASSDAERTRLRDRAADLKEQARAIMEKADAQRAAADRTCWERTFVSSCIEDADATHRQSVATARKLELEAREIERDMRTRAAEARRAEKQRSAEERRNKSIEMSIRTRDAEKASDLERSQDAALRKEKASEATERARLKEQEAARRDAQQAEKAAPRGCRCSTARRRPATPGREDRRTHAQAGRRSCPAGSGGRRGKVGPRRPQCGGWRCPAA